MSSTIVFIFATNSNFRLIKGVNSPGKSKGSGLEESEYLDSGQVLGPSLGGFLLPEIIDIKILKDIENTKRPTKDSHPSLEEAKQMPLEAQLAKDITNIIIFNILIRVISRFLNVICNINNI